MRHSFMRVMTKATGPSYVPTDPDAAVYIAAVEAADGNVALEDGVREAIDDFVIGCKADGIWNAIVASCILAGARTLAGALVPLVGVAPTNNGFLSGNYDRVNGIKGDGSKKLDTNVANNNTSLLPQNNRSVCIWLGPTGSGNDNLVIGSGGSSGYNTQMHTGVPLARLCDGSGGFVPTVAISGNYSGFVGMRRISSVGKQWRIGGATDNLSTTAGSPSPGNIFTHGRANLTTAPMIAFYALGLSLDLELFDARLATLMSDIAAAIP